MNRPAFRRRIPAERNRIYVSGEIHREIRVPMLEVGLSPTETASAA